MNVKGVQTGYDSAYKLSKNNKNLPSSLFQIIQQLEEISHELNSIKDPIGNNHPYKVLDQVRVDVIKGEFDIDKNSSGFATLSITVDSHPYTTIAELYERINFVLKENNATNSLIEVAIDTFSRKFNKANFLITLDLNDFNTIKKFPIIIPNDPTQTPIFIYKTSILSGHSFDVIAHHPQSKRLRPVRQQLIKNAKNNIITLAIGNIPNKYQTGNSSILGVEPISLYIFNEIANISERLHSGVSYLVEGAKQRLVHLILSKQFPLPEGYYPLFFTNDKSSISLDMKEFLESNKQNIPHLLKKMRKQPFYDNDIGWKNLVTNMINNMMSDMVNTGLATSDIVNLIQNGGYNQPILNKLRNLRIAAIKNNLEAIIENMEPTRPLYLLVDFDLYQNF